MSKNDFVRGLVAMALGLNSVCALAQTFDEISEKNRELMRLNVDIELARKKNELKKELFGKSEISSDATAPAAAPRREDEGKLPSASGLVGQQISLAPLVRAPAAGDGDVSQLSLKAVYGDETNPFVEFTYQGSDLAAVHMGDMVLPAWRLRAVNGRVAVIERLGKNGKAIATRTLMLGTPTPHAPVTRYDSPRSAPTVSIPKLPSLPGRP